MGELDHDRGPHALHPASAMARRVFAVGRSVAGRHTPSRDSSIPALRDQTERATEADRNEERLWQLLAQGTVTLSQLREQGVKAPAQGLYDLQLVGYVIDRPLVQDEAGAPTLGYRLSRTRETGSAPPASPERPRDRPLTAPHPTPELELH